MTGLALPDGIGAAVEEWGVPDPVSMEYEDTTARCATEIEKLVMNLILKLRPGAAGPPIPPVRVRAG